MKQFVRTFTLILIGLLTMVALPLQAQDDHHGHNPQITYYTAADEQGIHQVYQLLLDSEQDGHQLTHAANDVVAFGVAYDGLAIAYTSTGQLWLQPIHTEEAEALVTLNITEFFRSPVFSQDGNYIAFTPCEKSSISSDVCDEQISLLWHRKPPYSKNRRDRKLQPALLCRTG